MGIREGLSFSDYFDDSVPYEVKPTFVTTPTVEEEISGQTITGLGWLDRNGRYYRVGSASGDHYTWGANYLTSKGVQFTEDTIEQKMYDLGFIRIATNSPLKKLFFEYDKKNPPNALQLRTLRNYCIEKGWELEDETKSRNLELESKNYGFVQPIDYPTRAKDLFKGLWETEELKRAGFTSFWLDKKGNFISAGSSHLNWAKSYLSKNHTDYDEYRASEKIFQLGFIRVSLYRSSKEMYFEYDKRVGPPDERQMAALKTAAIELGFKLQDGVKNKEIDLTESLLFEDMLKEQSRILAKNTDYWLDPQGKFHDTSIEGSHMNWAKKYAALKDVPYHNEGSAYDPLFQLGFVRVVTDNHQIMIQYSKQRPPTNLQWRTLKDAAIESGLFLHDDVANKIIELKESLNLGENRDNKELFIESMMPKDMDTFKSHLAQLFTYLQKELQLKTVPKVKLLSDEKNASKILGKTAYYDPDTRTVNLYITDRHQKDILRSFSHEIVHHWQHENEKLQTSTTGRKTDKKEGEDPQYAQHNPWLRQMEKQAYLLGNMLFRDWEDKKKAQDRKSSKKMVEKTYLIGKEYPPKKMDYSG
jgi:hypothetical protein